MNSKKIPFISPSFPDSSLVARDYEAILSSNWFSNFGPFEQTFRKGLQSYIGDGIHVVTVNNATNGLMMAIEALFERSSHKNKVLMPAFTFAAGAEALILLGYEPVFIDIEERTLQPSISGVEEYLIEHDTEVAGILYCNVFGVGSPNIGDWETVAKKFSKKMIVDSAAGFGSKYANGARIGTRGDCEVFSFHATKPFAVGEGGAISTQSEALAVKLRQLSNFGFDQTRQASLVGMNAKLQEFNCAIGIRQLEDFDKTLTSRQLILKKYKAAFIGEDVYFQDNDDISSVAFCSIIVKSNDIADKFYSLLIANNIEARRYYEPQLYKHPAIRKKSSLLNNLATTDSIAGRIISLPVHRLVGDNEIALIKSLYGTVI